MVVPTGFFQSLAPDASPMKFSTPIGALSGNRVQVILPAVVSMMAVGRAGACTAGWAAALGLAAGAAWLLVCAKATKAVINISIRINNALRMGAPWI
ncbi:hypothetical protein SBA1_1030028 [Candidatus Sulfotelmatobacter kueseliae]|uniref:Uncharacterized protein n=1 Tax=Candidatus Sulfotelmatobacter kueseliae TaxID=2042962 RepID=A0A2U3JXD8_9BACT|nr:hypothetical protein SBA1_1030028 [Candidatus Sulfotelmatobacter kueseliae]